MRLGIFNMRNEDDVTASEIVVADPELQADAAQATTDVVQLEQLADELANYGEVQEGVDELETKHNVQVKVMDGDYSVVGNEVKVAEDDVNITVDAKELGSEVGNDDGELLTPQSTDQDASEASAKLESDLQQLLGRVNGNFRTNRGRQGLVSSRKESDFKASGKRGYRARVESISEVGKKVWEAIKSFFAKIWEFLKGLFERFTALFKSNKSVLEGLKNKLENEEDNKYNDIKEGAEISQQLAYFTEVKGSEINSFLKTPAEFVKEVKSVLMVKGDNDKTAVNSNIGETLKKDRQEGVNIKGIDAAKIKTKNARGTFYMAAGISAEGLVVVGFEGEKFKTTTVKFEKPKAFKNSKSNARSMLIDICDIGIEICEELDNSLVKDAKNDFEEIRKEAEDMINELYDRDDETKNNDTLKNQQKSAKANCTSAVSTFSKIIAVVAQQPSHAVSAVRNGMSICKSKKD